MINVDFPTQCLSEHARDFREFQFAFGGSILGFGSVLWSVSVAVTVLHLSGIRCVDHFALAAVNVGVRQTPLFQ